MKELKHILNSRELKQSPCRTPLIQTKGPFSRDARDIQSEQSEMLMLKAKILMKTPEDELQNVFLMKLSPQSLKFTKQLCIQHILFLAESFRVK